MKEHSEELKNGRDIIYDYCDLVNDIIDEPMSALDEPMSALVINVPLDCSEKVLNDKESDLDLVPEPPIVRWHTTLHCEDYYIHYNDQKTLTVSTPWVRRQALIFQIYV